MTPRAHAWSGASRCCRADRTTEDRSLPSIAPYLIGAATILGCGSFLIATGRPWSPGLTLLPFFGVWAALSLVPTTFLLLRHRRGVPGGRNRVLEGFAFALLLALIQGSFHSVKQTIGDFGFTFDAPLAALDSQVHGPALWLRTSNVLPDLPLKALDRIYLAWGLEAMAFSVWLSWSRSVDRDRARVAWILLWAVGGVVLAVTFASGGPVYFAPDAEAVTRMQRLDLVTPHTQAWLWAVHKSHVLAAFAGISAFPSMHVGGAVFIALVTVRQSRWLGWILFAYAAVMQFGSVALGWHYAIDGYAGAVLAVACWLCATAVTPSARTS